MPRSISAPHQRLNWHATVAAPFFCMITLWLKRQAHRQAMSKLLDAGPRLVSDAGFTVEDAEIAADTPIWRSQYLPPLRPF